MLNDLLAEYLGEGLSSVILAAAPIGLGALLWWAGSRLVFKLVNRGVGK